MKFLDQGLSIYTRSWENADRARFRFCVKNTKNSADLMVVMAVRAVMFGLKQFKASTPLSIIAISSISKPGPAFTAWGATATGERATMLFLKFRSARKSMKKTMKRSLLI
ncbi:UNVERIFIED_CONTAM: hypothetical protein GTU68_059243 [Idotea baltica]|nr:hypothetical protein [Idotea baltica]